MQKAFVKGHSWNLPNFNITSRLDTDAFACLVCFRPMASAYSTAWDKVLRFQISKVGQNLKDWNWQRCNVAIFIKGVIAIASILFIIRLFTSGFSVLGNYTTNKETRQERKSRTELNKAKTEKIKKETNK